MGDLEENLKVPEDSDKGIPYLCFLFTLVVDVLGRLIDKATQCSAIRGFVVGKDNWRCHTFSLSMIPYSLWKLIAIIS